MHGMLKWQVKAETQCVVFSAHQSTNIDVSQWLSTFFWPMDHLFKKIIW